MGYYKKQQIAFEEGVQTGFEVALQMMEQLLEKQEHAEIDHRPLKDIIGILKNTSSEELEYMLNAPNSSPAFH